jgi:hypothetical protein
MTSVPAATAEPVRPEAAAEVPRRGPRGTLRVLRIVAALHALCAIAQPMLAGVYLGGEVDALDLHGLNANIVAGLGVVQLIAAIVFVSKGRGRAWPLHATIAIVVAEQVQIALGFEGIVAVHIPLGVSIISMQILLTVWLFRAASGVARSGRRRTP